MRGAILIVAMLLTSSIEAQSLDISARRLLSGWKAEDPNMRMLAEVVASAFASGLSWRGSLAGKDVYCLRWPERSQAPRRTAPSTTRRFNSSIGSTFFGSSAGPAVSLRSPRSASTAILVAV